ncbi:MAG: pyridoxal phosphate-dependent aminotransferase [Oscillospiraceae bacterium]|nr:pyridoxal phosphate-dependent aminotransferase [Oscillospiraceae bacterium]
MVNKEMALLGTQRSVIRELAEYGRVRAQEIGKENVFDFSIGNPSVPCPPQVTETAAELLANTDPVLLHGYTSAQGDQEVRERIAENLNARFQADVRADNLYITVGAAAALCSCLNGLVCPGDQIVVNAPFFPEYKVFIEKAGAEMCLVDADTEAFQINFPLLEQAVNPNTKAVLINSPNNPSGAIYSLETVEKLAELLEAKSALFGHPIYLISDEPYREIVFDGAEVPFLPSIYANTLVCYSWSKSLSLPGERLGYVLVGDQVEDAETVYAAVAGAARALGYVNAPSLFQQICSRCVDLTSDISVYETNARILTEALTGMGFRLVPPQGTFYMFPETLEKDDESFCRRARDMDLLIVPGSGFGCPGHTRISYCVPTERVERSLPVFQALADSYK